MTKKLSECPYCKRPADEAGSIFHVGGCTGLQEVPLNRLQYDMLTQERHQLRNELTAARLESERLGGALDSIHQERLTWAMVCECSCAACEKFSSAIRKAGHAHEPVSAPVEYVLEQRCKCGLIWRVHAEYSFRVNQIFCACGKKIYIDRDAVKSAPEPSDGYSQAYADQMRAALLHISKPVFLNLKPAYADPDNVKAICDGLNERIKLAQEALLPPSKSNPAPETSGGYACMNCAGAGCSDCTPALKSNPPRLPCLYREGCKNYDHCLAAGHCHPL